MVKIFVLAVKHLLQLRRDNRFVPWIQRLQLGAVAGHGALLYQMVVFQPMTIMPARLEEVMEKQEWIPPRPNGILPHRWTQVAAAKGLA